MMAANQEQEQDDIDALLADLAASGEKPELAPAPALPVEQAEVGDDIDVIITQAQQEAQTQQQLQQPTTQQVEPGKSQSDVFKEALELYNQSEMAGNPSSNLDYLEPISRGAVGMIATAINGVYSGAQALFPGDTVLEDAEQFEKRQDWINDNIIMPKTEEGKSATKALEWLGEKLAIPVSGYVGLAELIMTQDPNKATESIRAIQSGEKSFGDILGDANFAVTGDPAWAAAVKTAGDGLPALIGARYTQKPLVEKRLLAQADDLQNQMQGMMLRQQQTGELMDNSPVNMANRQLTIIDEQTQQARRIGYDEMSMIEAEMRNNPDYAKRIAQSISSKPDPAAAEVIRQGSSKGSVANMKATNPETRKIMRRMLGNANRVLNDDSLASELRPSMAMGDIVERRIGFLNNKRQQIGQELNAAVRDFDNQIIPLEESSRIANNFVNSLQEMNVKFDAKTLQPLFDDSSIRDIPEFVRIISNTTRDLATKEMTARELHFFKKRLDENISFGQKQEGLSANVEQALQGLRSDINEYLGRQNPAYRDANRKYAEVKTAIDNAEIAFKLDRKKLQLNPDLKQAHDIEKIGQELRKTLSNYAGGVDIRNVLTNVEEVAGKYGLNDRVQVRRLISFDNQLNNMMPSLIPGGAKSVVGQGIDSARVVQDIKGSVLDRVFQGVNDVYDDMRGVNETNASLALTRMLDELDEAAAKGPKGRQLTTRNP